MNTDRYDSLYMRLVKNIEEPAHEADCWRWKGNKDSKGYGRMSVRLKPGARNPTGVRVHRLIFEILYDVKLDPDLQTIEHRCLNTSCLNPDHLTVVTRAQNTKLMNERRKTTA